MAQEFNLNAALNIQRVVGVQQAVQQVQQAFRNSGIDINMRVSSASARVLDELNAKIGVLRNNLVAVQGSTLALSQGLGNIGAAARTSVGGVGSLNQALVTSTGVFRAIREQAVEGSTAMERFGSQIGQTARRFAAFTVVGLSFIALARGIREGFSEALSFERQMVKLAQVSEDSREQIAGIQQEVTRLSTTLGVSSRELLASAVTLKQAGLSAQETKTALEAVSRASLAPNFGSMKEIVEGSIAVIRQFDKDVGNLETHLGAMNAVAGQFATEASDLVEVIRRAGGAFQQTGGNLNELLGLFTAVRSTSRESAETIATGLRTIFTRIQRNDTVQALKDLQIHLRYTKEEADRMNNVNLTNQFVGPYEAIKRISEGLGAIRPTDPRFAGIVEELGGLRQISRIVPLLTQFSEVQKAVNVAQAGSTSLQVAAEKAQDALLVRTAAVKEEYLALFRTLVQSDGFKSLANSALSMASSLAKVLEFAKPLIPVFTTLAAIKLVENFTPFAGRVIQNLAYGRNQLPAAPIRAARGGVVPGQGDTDSVATYLMPGEFVIRKKSAQQIGYAALRDINESGGMSRLASGSDQPIKKLLGAPSQLMGWAENRYGKKSLAQASMLGQASSWIGSLAVGMPLPPGTGVAASIAIAELRHRLRSPQAIEAEKQRQAIEQLEIEKSLNNIKSLPKYYGNRFAAGGSLRALKNHLSEDEMIAMVLHGSRANYNRITQEIPYESSGDRYYASLLTNALKKRNINKLIPAGSKFLGHGIAAMAFQSPSSNVYRVQPYVGERPFGNERFDKKVFDYERPNIEPVLQNFGSRIIKNIYTEKLPFVPSIADQTGKKEVLDEVLADNLRQRLRKFNYDYTDFHTGNVGYHNGVLKILDPGSLMDISPNSKAWDSLFADIIPTAAGSKMKVYGASNNRSLGSNISLFNQFNSGGNVKDRVPALLTPGEFVLNREAVAQMGAARLHTMNVHGYARGGLVGEGGPVRLAGGSDDPITVPRKDLPKKGTVGYDDFYIQFKQALVEAGYAATRVKSVLVRLSTVGEQTIASFEGFAELTKGRVPKSGAAFQIRKSKKGYDNEYSDAESALINKPNIRPVFEKYYEKATESPQYKELAVADSNAANVYLLRGIKAAVGNFNKEEIKPITDKSGRTETFEEAEARTFKAYIKKAVERDYLGSKVYQLRQKIAKGTIPQLASGVGGDDESNQIVTRLTGRETAGYQKLIDEKTGRTTKLSVVEEAAARREEEEYQRQRQARTAAALTGTTGYGTDTQAKLGDMRARLAAVRKRQELTQPQASPVVVPSPVFPLVRQTGASALSEITGGQIPTSVEESQRQRSAGTLFSFVKPPLALSAPESPLVPYQLGGALSNISRGQIPKPIINEGSAGRLFSFIKPPLALTYSPAPNQSIPSSPEEVYQRNTLQVVAAERAQRARREAIASRFGLRGEATGLDALISERGAGVGTIQQQYGIGSRSIRRETEDAQIEAQRQRRLNEAIALGNQNARIEGERNTGESARLLVRNNTIPASALEAQKAQFYSQFRANIESRYAERDRTPFLLNQFKGDNQTLIEEGFVNRQATALADTRISRRGGADVLSQGTQNAIRDKALNEQIALSKTEFISAEKRLLASMYKNITPLEQNRIAHEAWNAAINGETRIIRENGRILGSQARVDAAKASGITPPGAGPIPTFFNNIRSRFDDFADRRLGGFNPIKGGGYVANALSGLGSIGPTAAFLGLPLVSGALDREAGAADVAFAGGVDRQNRYTNIKGISGALQFGTIGGTIGASAGGPYGAAFGVTIGAIYGFASSVKEAENDIRQAKVGKAISDFADKIQTLANAGSDANPGAISSALTSINTIRSENEKKAYEDSTSTVLRNTPDILRNTSTSSLLASVVHPVFGLLPPIQGFNRGDNVGEELALRAKNQRESFGQQLPTIIQAVNRQAEELGKKNPSSKLEDLSKDLEAGRQGLNRQLIGLVADLRGISVRQAVEEFAKVIEQSQKAAKAEQERQKAAVGEERNINALGRLLLAVQSATDGLSSFQTRTSALGDIFSGSLGGVRVNLGAERLSQIGRNDPEVFKTLGILRSVGGAGGNQAFESGQAITQVTQQLYSILPQVLSAARGGANEDQNIATRTRNALTQSFGGADALRANPQLLNAVNTVINQINQTDKNGGEDSIRRAVGTDASKFIESLIEPLAGPLKEKGTAIIKALQDNENAFIDGLARLTEQMRQVGELSDRAATGRVQSVRAQAEIADINSFSSPGTSLRRLSISTLQSDLQSRQERLTGLAGAVANDPTTIGRQLTLTLSQIDAAAQRQQEVAQTGGQGGVAQAARELNTLRDKAQNLQRALGNLADSSSRNAVIQERLSDIQQSRQAGLNYAERYATGSADQRVEMDRGVAFLISAVQSGNLNNLTDDQRRSAIEAGRGLGNRRLPLFGNETGNAVIDKLLANTPGLASVAGGTADEKAETQRLQQELIGNIQRSVEANDILSNTMKSNIENLLTNLSAQHTAFFTRLSAELSVIAQTDTRNKLTAASVEKSKFLDQRDQAQLLNGLGIGANPGQVSTQTARNNLENFRNYFAANNQLNRAQDIRENGFTSTVQTNLQNNLNRIPRGNVLLGNGLSPETRKVIEDVLKEGAYSDLTENQRGSIINRIQTNLPNNQEALRNIRGGNNRVLTDLVNRSIDVELAPNAGGLADATANRNRALASLAGSGINVGALQQTGGDGSNILRALETFDNVNNRIQDLPANLERVNNELAALAETLRATRPQPTLNDVGRLPILPFAAGGEAPSLFKPVGTDTVPAMLTPGEFVVNRASSQANTDLLHRINNARGPITLAKGGLVYAALGGQFDLLSLLTKRAEPELARIESINYGSYLQNTISNLRERQLESQTNPFAHFGFVKADSQSQTSLNQSAISTEQRFRELNYKRDFAFGLLQNDWTRSQKIPLKRASGGPIPGLSDGDTIPAYLSAGEYVLSRRAVQNMGGSANVARYAEGGVVPPSAAPALASPAQRPGAPVNTEFGQVAIAFNGFQNSSEVLVNSFHEFQQTVQTLATAISNFPRRLEVTGRQTIEHIFNGAEVFSKIQPAIKDAVEESVKTKLTEVFKQYLPEVGVNLN